VDGKYARMCNSSYIYSRVNKCFYKPLTDELQQFMNDIWGKYSLYKDSNMKTRNELRSFIREVVDDRFPFIKHDANLICFRNGVYDLSIAKLVPFEKVKTAVQARTYIDKDFEYQMDTPLLDSILKYQFTEDGVLDTETYTDVMEFLYICLGRLMTKVQDNYGFMLMLYGASNCGKSVFMELLKATFNVKTQVGILGSNKQAIFGLQDFYDKDLMICDDIKDMSKTLEKSLFLSMMTNGSVNVPIKNRESKAIDRWDIPLLICSNHMLNYKEESNEISRRLCIFEFPRIVDSECTDLGLVDEIKNTEICGFIHKCRSKYLEFYAKNKRTAIWNHYPEYIKRTLTDEYKSQNNNTYMFVRDRVEYAEGESVPSMEMNREFKSFVKTKYDLQRMPREALNRSSVYGFDPRIVFKSEMICKSCDCPHKAGCCSAYNRTNRTRTEFWYNCRLKY
jgi:phage/plasmid-associated DNA primase